MNKRVVVPVLTFVACFFSIRTAEAVDATHIAPPLSRSIVTEVHMAADFVMPDCVKVPPVEAVLKTLKADHPRIVATENDFHRVARLIETDPFAGQWFDLLARQADAMLDQPVSVYEIPDGKRLLSVSRRVLSRACTLAMVYRIRGDRNHLDRLWAEIEAAGEFKDWNPSHFLDTGEMTLAFAIAYDWLYDAWTPEQRRFMERAVLDKGLNAALSVGYGNGHAWFARVHHNWNQVCNAGLMAGALAMAEAWPETAAQIVSQSVASLPLAMTEYAPDGAYPEGPGYWSYGTTFNVIGLALLESSLGSDFGLSAIPGFEKAAMFPVYMTSPIGRTFNFCDSGDHAVSSPALLWFARRYHQPIAQDYYRHVVTRDGRVAKEGGRYGSLGLLWYDPKLNQLGGETYRDGFKFADVECASFFESYGRPDGMFLAFKGGSPGVNHGNCDIGSFVFDADGVRWAVDLGGENYNIPEYFQSGPGGRRWTYYRTRAEGHNTLAINPGKGEDQAIRSMSKITAFDDQGKTATAAVDMTPAYKDFGVASSVRRFAMSRGDGEDRYVRISDAVSLERPGELWWFMHTRCEVAVAADGRSATLSEDGRTLKVTLESPASACLTVMAAKALPTSPQPTESNPNEGVRKLAVHLEGIEGDVEISVKLQPLE